MLVAYKQSVGNWKRLIWLFPAPKLNGLECSRKVMFKETALLSFSYLKMLMEIPIQNGNRHWCVYVCLPLVGVEVTGG